MSEIELQSYISLLIIFSINFIEIGLPVLSTGWFLNKLKDKKILEKKKNLESHMDNKNIELSPKEISNLENSDEYVASMGDVENLIEEYLEIIIYIAYILLLSSSAPLTPLFVMILLIFEKGVDTYKFYNLLRLRELRNFSTITIFNYMILILIYVGTVTNIGMFVFSRQFKFTDPIYETDSEKNNSRQITWLIKIFLFMILQNFVVIVNYVLNIDTLPDCKNKIKFIFLIFFLIFLGFDHIHLIKTSYKYNYFKKMGNLPHKNIKINTFGNIQREDEFKFLNFYNNQIDREAFFKKLKERKKKDIGINKSESCC